MPRYFMHVRTGDFVASDSEGVELASLSSARSEALLSAREIVADRVRSGRAVTSDEFLITDETGNILTVVPFRDAVIQQR